MKTLVITYQANSGPIHYIVKAETGVLEEPHVFEGDDLFTPKAKRLAKFLGIEPEEGEWISIDESDALGEYEEPAYFTVQGSHGSIDVYDGYDPTK